MKAYVINLDRRPDRMELCRQELERAGVAFERVQAVDMPEDPRRGCCMSHAKALREGIKSGAESFVVLEDDAVFLQTMEEIEREVYFLIEDSDWDILYLGGNHHGGLGNVRRPYIKRVYATYSTHAYIIKRQFAVEMAQALDRAKVADVTFVEKQPSRFCLTFYPAVVTQRKGYSDIENREVDYKDLIK